MSTAVPHFLAFEGVAGRSLTSTHSLLRPWSSLVEINYDRSHRPQTYHDVCWFEVSVHIVHGMNLSSSSNDALENVFQLSVVSIELEVVFKAHIVLGHAECYMIETNVNAQKSSDML